ncbi:unnamed protein product [Mytilus coruscus]|uniref:C1q domain-containing protein n=1 Tax=Mytilus coruscus TaxID=42192 RepID=A0A6J8D7J4_MYTCO|nr:unnamed protein product [Mytilus coruscus]
MKSIQYQLKLVEENDGKCDCTGRSSGPDKVAFMAKNSDSLRNLPSKAVLVFNTVITNLGNGYDSSNGIFTAPSNGVYIFSWTVLCLHGKEFYNQLILNENIIAKNYASSVKVADHASGSQNVILEIKKDDRVFIRIQEGRTGQYMYGDGWSTFSGYKLYNIRNNDSSTSYGLWLDLENWTSVALERRYSNTGRTMTRQAQKYDKNEMRLKLITLNEKRTEVNLNYLRNDLDLWHRKVGAWLDNKKTNPPKDEIKTLGIEVVQRLYIRKVLKKKDIDDIKFPEPPLSPKRSCSASPNRQTSPGSGSVSRRSKSISRVSRKDQHENRDIKLKLEFEDEHQAYVPKKQSSLVSEKYYIENVNLKEEIKRLHRCHEDIEKEKENLKQKSFRKQFEDFVRNCEENTKELRLENIHLKESLIWTDTQYRQLEERNIELNGQLIELREKHAHCIQPRDIEKYKKEANMTKYENLKLKEDLESYRLKEAETNLDKSAANIECLVKERMSLKNVIENQKKHILEIQNRADATAKDANTAILHYTDEGNKYKEANDKAQAIVLKTRMEKDELLTKLKKLKAEKQQYQKSINSIHVMQKKIKELEKEKKCSTECNTNLSHKLATYESQLQELLNKQRDLETLKREGKSNRKLQEENDTLRNALFEMENKHSADIRQHIQEEEKCKRNISNLKKERDDARTKAGSHNQELNYNAFARMKEQEVLYSVEKSSLEEKVEDLKYQLAQTESNGLDAARYVTDDYNKEQLDQKNEEIVRLTRMVYSLDERLKLSTEQNKSLEAEKEEQIRRVQDLSDQLNDFEERCSSQSNKRLSDIEKQNVSLNKELSMALGGLAKAREEYTNLENRCILDKEMIKSLKSEKDVLEIEKNNLNDQIRQLQEQWDRFKNDESTQQELSRKEITSLQRQEVKLQQDNQALRKQLHSLENKISEQDRRFKHTESDDLKYHQRSKAELESLQRLYDTLVTDHRILEAKYETVNKERSKQDAMVAQQSDENNRLKKELKIAKAELHTAERERDKFSQNLQQELNCGKLELDRLKKEKTELITEFEVQSKKYIDKIYKLELENKTLHERFSSGEKTSQYTAYELMQLKSNYETCKKQKADAENELLRFKLSVTDFETKLREKESHQNQICEQYEQEIRKLKRQIEEIKESLTKAEHQRCAKCDEYQINLTMSEREKEELQRKYTIAITSGHNTEKEVQELKDLIQEERNKRREIQEELNTMEKEKKDLEIKFRLKSTATSKESELQTENTKLKQRLAVNNENNLSLQKENEKLKSLVNEKGREVQNMDSRLQEFVNSKENSEVLRKQMGNLKLENSDLNKRLADNNEKNSSLLRENEKLKNNLEEKRRNIKNFESRLADNNEEKSSLNNENRQLTSVIKEKEREIKNLEARLQDLTDSNESSNVLRKQLQNLQLELNKRIEEKTSLHNENKELKHILQENLAQVKSLETRLADKSKQQLSLNNENNELKEILQEKLSEVKSLETRLKQYAEKIEGFSQLKRHIDKLQSDNAELNQKCRHLKTVEKDVQKLKQEKQQLETEIITQKQNNETLNSRLEILSVEKLEIEDRLRRRSPQVVTDPRNCQNCWKYRNDISDLKREINDLRDRLSEAAGNKLRDNNPNIADLSDMNRPTSLAEKFSSLYTDEYTDAMEVIEDDMDEAASVKVMLEWLKSCYSWCQKLAKEQRDTLINKSIGFMQNHGGQNVVLSDRCLIFVKEFQKKIAVESLVVVGQICHVKSVTQQSLSSENYIVKYIKKCSELCWMMQISDPPLYLNFDVNSGENLNKNDYNVFTKSGSKIDYLVWPVLYLHKTGPMLAKGVAQGK